MNNPLYLIASLITVLLITDRALIKFFDMGPFAPKKITALFLITALILFSIHFYKKSKKQLR